MSSFRQTNLTSSPTVSSESREPGLLVSSGFLVLELSSPFSPPRPFRRLDGNGDLRWEKIKSLDKGDIYKQVNNPGADPPGGSSDFDLLTLCLVLQGNLFDFLRLTGWRGSKVLYFGDHLYSDLAVSDRTVLLSLGWGSKGLQKYHLNQWSPTPGRGPS